MFPLPEVLEYLRAGAEAHQVQLALFGCRVVATDAVGLQERDDRVPEGFGRGPVVDAIKMTAYQIETELLEMLREHYQRTEDEGRTFLQSAFQSCGRLEVGTNELRVTLATQSSPHRSRALAALCEKLNVLDSCFRGTNLRLHLAVEPHEPLIP